MEYKKSIINDSVRFNKVLAECFLFAILPPILGLPLVIFRILNKPWASKQEYYNYFACIALYMGALNATKVVSGDQINYCWAYLNVPTVGLLGSMKNIYGYAVAMGGKGAENISGEFMNGIYNYFGYYLTSGYYNLFAAGLTFMNYFLTFVGLYKFCQTLHKPHIPIVCGVIIISFFYLYFIFSLHIQKQFLAEAIMIYVIGSYAYEGKMSKRLWIITLISVFTHQSMLLFVPFLFIKRICGALDKKGLIILGVILVIVIVLGPSMVSRGFSEKSGSTLVYGVERFGNLDGESDGSDGSLDPLKMILVALPMCWILYRKLWIDRRTLNTNALVLNIVLILLLSVFAMYNMPLARYRYFMMLYSFMPFLYPFFSDNILNRNRILKIIASFIFLFFYINYNNMEWNYCTEFDAIAYPPVYLIFGGYRLY